MDRRVSCALTFAIERPTVLALQIAASPSGSTCREELLAVAVDGADVSDRTIEVVSATGGRSHLVQAEAGRLEVHYDALVSGEAAHSVIDPPGPVYDDAAIVGLRQSRYCPSDLLEGFARAEFGDAPPSGALAREVAAWVFERVAYEGGSSDSADSALETLATNVGVCRDFAHLTIVLCRALGIPARLAAVYAPGLSPMDFHAVTEVRVGTRWETLDSTRLAPRSSLVRIATGRDAADTAFATTLTGDAELRSYEVSAVVEGDLPADDHVSSVVLP